MEWSILDEFFNKNLKQDKLFIEVNNRLSLSYWMASDIDHFVENFPELINKDILKQIIKNSNSLNAFFEQTKEDISKLNGIHKECALEIYHLLKFVWKSLNALMPSLHKMCLRTVNYLKSLILI